MLNLLFGAQFMFVILSDRSERGPRRAFVARRGGSEGSRKPALSEVEGDLRLFFTL
jgi:hypothetical protein